MPGSFSSLILRRLPLFAALILASCVADPSPTAEGPAAIVDAPVDASQGAADASSAPAPADADGGSPATESDPSDSGAPSTTADGASPTLVTDAGGTAAADSGAAAPAACVIDPGSFRLDYTKVSGTCEIQDATVELTAPQLSVPAGCVMKSNTGTCEYVATCTKVEGVATTVATRTWRYRSRTSITGTMQNKATLRDGSVIRDCRWSFVYTRL